MYKLILADNQAIFRSGMAKMMAMEDDFRIVAQCSEANRLFSAVESFSDAILVFASSLKLDSGRLVSQVVEAGRASLVIAENGEGIQPWLSLGVRGAVSRDVSGPALLECVRHVARGKRQVRPAGLAASDHQDTVGTRVRNSLTPKEMKILGLLLQGGRNKDIARRLNTTEQVIKNYLRGMYDKTGVSDRLELALFTIHHKSLAEAANTVGNLILQSESCAVPQPA
jgi:DNA-binding NarL/FixJ family response regulator